MPFVPRVVARLQDFEAATRDAAVLFVGRCEAHEVCIDMCMNMCIDMCISMCVNTNACAAHHWKALVESVITTTGMSMSTCRTCRR